MGRVAAYLIKLCCGKKYSSELMLSLFFPPLLSSATRRRNIFIALLPVCSLHRPCCQQVDCVYSNKSDKQKEECKKKKRKKDKQTNISLGFVGRTRAAEWIFNAVFVVLVEGRNSGRIFKGRSSESGRTDLTDGTEDGGIQMKWLVWEI